MIEKGIFDNSQITEPTMQAGDSNHSPTAVIAPTLPANTLTYDDKLNQATAANGYPDVDSFLAAFEIPIEVKARVIVCQDEETTCLSVYEKEGEPNFYFKNITDCELDGKRASGASNIPVGFDGMVRGFTVRPWCIR